MTTILLIEDNDMSRDMLSRRLRRKGFDLLCAADGITGIELAQSDSPDLILMDISLPVMDGLQATKQLKSDATTEMIPIIALTAHAMSGDREKCLAAGCDDYATKPVEFPALLSKIKSWAPEPT